LLKILEEEIISVTETYEIFYLDFLNMIGSILLP